MCRYSPEYPFDVPNTNWKIPILFYFGLETFLPSVFRYQGTTFYLAFLQRFFYFPDKELWPEEKEWLKTRAPGPPRE